MAGMKTPSGTHRLSPAQTTDLLATLARRFAENPARHEGISWEAVADRLRAHPAKLWSLHEMERTGGAPDVVAQDACDGTFVFFDCSPETPAGRVAVCYDRAGLESRKEHKPAHNAVDLAAAMGVQLLTVAEYRDLQKLGAFDTKTSSWVQTPPAIRRLGGALFGDRRYDEVFIYHNGAQSYYSARAFRASLRV
jgi:hypothetical protein